MPNSTIDSYSYADLRKLVAGEKKLTVGELKKLTKELLLFVLRTREKAQRSDRRAEFVTEDPDNVDLEDVKMSDDEINDIEVTL